MIVARITIPAKAPATIPITVPVEGPGARGRQLCRLCETPALGVQLTTR